MAYRKISPEERAKRRLNAAVALAERRSRERWYITLSIKPPETFVNSWGGTGYHKMAWGKLYRSEDAAWKAAGDWFTHPGQKEVKRPGSFDKTTHERWLMPDGRRIVSYALSSTYLPKVNHEETA